MEVINYTLPTALFAVYANATFQTVELNTRSSEQDGRYLPFQTQIVVGFHQDATAAESERAGAS